MLCMYLPWNNPLVGTAFLLRARRGNLLLNVSLYIILLVMGMAGWQYYVAMNAGNKLQFNPQNQFLLILFGAQCFISGLLMLGQAGGALKNEVMNKTLDFQRIAAIGPWDILLGKLLGTPVMAYLLAIASIPIAVFTLMNGAAGISLIALFLSWIQILTFVFLLGTFAIQNTLQITSAKGTGASAGFGIFMALLGLVVYATFGPSDSLSYLSDPRRNTLGALFTPFTAYAGLSVQNPWMATFSWFGLEIPCLLFSPIAHLVIGAFCLSIMARRLALVDNTPLGKKLGYLFLVLGDLVIAGVLFSCGRTGKLGAAGMSLDMQVGFFLIAHMGLTFVYYVMLTPHAEFMLTWIWRFRTPTSFVRDSLLLDRAPNTMSIGVNVLCAAVGVCLLCLLNPTGSEIPNFLLDTCLTATVTIVFVGLLYQALQLISRKHGNAMYLVIILVFVAVPVMAGMLLNKFQMVEYQMLGKGLLYITPLTQLFRYTANQAGDPFLTDIVPYPMVAIYLVLSLLLWLYTRRVLNARIRRIDLTRSRLLEPKSPAPAAV